MIKKLYGATNAEGYRRAMREASEDVHTQEEIDAVLNIVNAWEAELAYAEFKGIVKCATIVGVGYLFARVIK